MFINLKRLVPRNLFMRQRFFIILIFFLLIFIPAGVKADDSPRQNNKFGIHLAQPHLEDLKAASELVNTNGGDWGYATLVIEEKDRNTGKWQEIFNKMRKYHLIPIIRLATSPIGDNWRRPEKKDVDDWLLFLESLNWVTKERYIVLFNEPNHGSEWGGEVDAKNYGETALNFAKKLKEKNPDYFIMLGGLDASAPSYRPSLEDEYVFFQLMFTSVSKQDFEKYIDGLSSHSYPNPAFAGSPYAWGRGTIHGYVWELDILKEFGISKLLPVYITETGWSADRLSRGAIASSYQNAFLQWLDDDRVVAVTPFVLDYQSSPFLQFSFKEFGQSSFYQQYYSVQSMTKKRGEPEQLERGGITFDLPRELLVNSSYHFRVHLTNDGQAYWDKKDGYVLKFTNYPASHYIFSDIADIQPGQSTDVDFFLKTTGKIDESKIQIILFKGDKEIIKGPVWKFSVAAPPSISLKTSLWPKFTTSGEDFEIQVFDDRENVLFKKSGVIVKEGRGEIESVQNVALGVKYRVVILKPYYLPRQQFVVFKKGKNKLLFNKMLPFDFNLDGKSGGEDMMTFLRNPGFIELFSP